MSIALGQRLADLRKRNGLSQEALAEKLNISRQAISKWERGESTPDTDTLIELARIYGVSLDTIAGISDDETEKTDNKEKTKKKKNKKTESAQPLFPGMTAKLLKFPLPILFIALYIFIGIAMKIWHPTWLLFLLIPAYYHLALATRAKTMRGFLLALPVPEITVMLFLMLGFALSAWKYAWILFVADIFYYCFAAAYVKK